MISDSIDKRKWSGQRIGLLGGSFNPAHEGHLAISEAALEKLKLDHVWWLMSPQNPLKETKDLASFEARLLAAKELTNNPRIYVSGLEQEYALDYTVQTLEFLKSHLLKTHFVWLMGIDCLLEFDRWKSWEKIIKLVPIAVFARPGYSVDALTGQVAARLKDFRWPEKEVPRLATATPPAWVYFEGPMVELSATQLRNQAEAK